MNSEVLASLLLSVLLGAVVGVERELTHKPAGLRTHMLVSLGSCLFTLISISFKR
jgi:putative Mg2+ transporter-C (MgtC) family protein